MIRNLKVLGLALVAICAISAMLASAASAQFESEASETRLTVSSNAALVFKYEESSEASVTCKKAALTETIVKGTSATSVTGTGHVSECVGPLGTTATVSGVGCDGNVSLAKSSTTGKAKLECTAGKTVTVAIGALCTFSFSPQEAGNLKYTNVGTGTTREVTIDPEVTGVKGSRTGSALCGAATSTTGTYKGSVTITGENTAGTAHIGIFVD